MSQPGEAVSHYLIMTPCVVRKLEHKGGQGCRFLHPHLVSLQLQVYKLRQKIAFVML